MKFLDPINRVRDEELAHWSAILAIEVQRLAPLILIPIGKIIVRELLQIISVRPDVVYNHIGPDGNYLKQFSDDYFTDRYQNEWGEALNFDGENSGPVREFFVSNAVYWIQEFHLDGLRLDATQQIFDRSAEHILAAISRKAREAARGRGIYLVAENESQHSKLVRPVEQGGYGLDA